MALRHADRAHIGDLSDLGVCCAQTTALDPQSGCRASALIWLRAFVNALRSEVEAPGLTLASVDVTAGGGCRPNARNHPGQQASRPANVNVNVRYGSLQSIARENYWLESDGLATTVAMLGVPSKIAQRMGGLFIQRSVTLYALARLPKGKPNRFGVRASAAALTVQTRLRA